MEFDKAQAEKILAELRRRLERREPDENAGWDVPGLNCELPKRRDGAASCQDPDVDAALDALSMATGIVYTLPENAVSDEGAVQLLSEIADARRRLDGAYLKVVALVDKRGAARCSGIGAQTTAGLLKAVAGVLPGRAKADVADARALHGENSGSGLSPESSFSAGPLADMSELLAAGEVSIGHVDTAVRTLTKVPEQLLNAAMPPSEDECSNPGDSTEQQTVRQRICKYFAETAPTTSPEKLRRLGKHLVEVLDPDADDHFDPDAFNRRSMTMSRDFAGMVFGTYQLDAAAGAALRAILDPLAAPRPTQRDADGSVLVQDTRTAEQRRADALCELAAVAAPMVPHAEPVSQSGAEAGAETGAGSEESVETQRAEARRNADRLFGFGEDSATGSSGRPSAASKLRPGRGQARITIITTAEKMTGSDRAPSHCFQIGEIGPGTLARMTCDASFERLVLDAPGAVLDLGRPVRLASPSQRRAISARDKGCVFPGCDRPPSWCDVHHVLWYSRGGATDVSNMCLLCPAHHSLIHTGRWQLMMIDGIPYAKPAPGTIKVRVRGMPPTVFDTYSAGDDWVRNSYFDRLKETEELAAAITRNVADAA